MAISCERANSQLPFESSLDASSYIYSIECLNSSGVIAIAPCGPLPLTTAQLGRILDEDLDGFIRERVEKPER